MNVLGTVKFVGGLAIGAGCNTICNKLLKPTLDGLNTFQKVTSGLAIAAFSGYIGEKSTEYFSNSLDELHEAYLKFKKQKEDREEGDEVE